MAKPDLVPVYANPEGQTFRMGGMHFKPLELNTVIRRQVGKRSGPIFQAHTPLDLTALGLGWAVFGSPIEIEDETDLLVNIKIYRNGQLLMGSGGFSPDFDFYFVEKNKLAFIFSIRTSEVLQISKNFQE